MASVAGATTFEALIDHRRTVKDAAVATERAASLREMLRVLVPGGRLLLSFHVGEDHVHVEEDLWGFGVALETTLFRVGTIADFTRQAGFEIEETVEREPYAPEVEYQSRRAYIFAHKPTKKIRSA